MKTATIAILTLCLVAAPHAAGDGWRAGQGDVRVLCPLTVGGSFEARTTALTGALAAGPPGSSALSGQLSVDLRTLDSGIELRNDHLRNKYLEAGKGEGFDTAVLSDIVLGKADAGTVQGKTTFTGTLLLHGTKKPVSGEAEIRRSPSSVRVSASFPITLADYGIAKPQYLGIGVRNQVRVKVTFVAAPAGAGA